jgi:hypothetical protein
MAANPNWPRWIFASLAVHFKGIADGLPLNMIAEGVDERESETMQGDRCELRINGPSIRESSKNYWRVWINVNILLTDYMEGQGENTYKLMNWGGAFLEGMNLPIPIYKYGPDVGGVDDQTLLGCLTMLRGSSDESIRLIHFGQIGQVERVRQAAVDGRFEMYLNYPNGG